MVSIADADFSVVRKPFKAHGYKPPPRRYKNPKAIISEEQKRLASIENLNHDKATYSNIEAPPSLLPRKWYCDITGLEGRYKSVQHGLRYHNRDVYQVIQELSQGVDQQYLELRNANVVLR